MIKRALASVIALTALAASFVSLPSTPAMASTAKAATWRVSLPVQQQLWSKTSIVPLNDGTSLVNLVSNNGLSVIKVRANGSLDTGFGAGGVAKPFVGAESALLPEVFPQADGKFLVATIYNEQQGLYRMAMVGVERFTAAGQLDTGYGIAGRASYATQRTHSYNTFAAVRVEDKIEIVKTTPSGSEGAALQLTRFTASGAPDTTLSATGTVTVEDGVTNLGTTFAVTTSGVVYSFSATKGYRVNLDGGLPTFSFDRVGEANYNAFPNASTLQVDDKVVTVGRYERCPIPPRPGDICSYVQRTALNSAPDAGFGDPTQPQAEIGNRPGIQVVGETSNSTGTVNELNDVRVMGNGTIVAVGRSGSKAMIAYFTPAGLPASRYGDNGIVRDDSGPDIMANAMAVVGNRVLTTQVVGMFDQTQLVAYDNAPATTPVSTTQPPTPTTQPPVTVLPTQNTPTGVSTAANYAIVHATSASQGFGASNGIASPALRLNQPVVGSASTPGGKGYWSVSTDGGIFTAGDARFYGSTGDLRLNKPIVGMAATPTGKGYWLVASDGGIFTFGDAAFFGSTGSLRLNKPVVGMGSTPSGKGYWLVASDGGIFTFGDAGFHGSAGSLKLNSPVLGMTSSPSGKGYWMVAADGGIFTYGDASFHGSTGSLKLNQPVVGMASTPSGKGYWLVARDGGVFTFGDAGFLGAGTGAGNDVVAISSGR